MAIKNLGEPNLGATSLSDDERQAWPSHKFTPPKRIEFTSADTVTNEVYFRRSTAYKRAKELLESSVVYMVYHMGVTPDSVYFPTFGGGIVVVDDDVGASAAGAGFYHDACNGQLLAEHVIDPEAKLKIKQKTGGDRTIDTVAHFHVATYGKTADEYSNLDIDNLRQEVYELNAGLQRDMLASFGTGIRQYLPTYFHSRRDIGELGGFDPDKVPFESFTGMRVPKGLKSRRSYELKSEISKHHIYYLNSPGGHYFVDEPDWR